MIIPYIVYGTATRASGHKCTPVKWFDFQVKKNVFRFSKIASDTRVPDCR